MKFSWAFFSILLVVMGCVKAIPAMEFSAEQKFMLTYNRALEKLYPKAAYLQEKDLKVFVNKAEQLVLQTLASLKFDSREASQLRLGNVDMPNSIGDSPLLFLIRRVDKSNVELVKHTIILLLALGADIDYVNSYVTPQEGATAVSAASKSRMRESQEIMHTLIQLGADVQNSQQNQGTAIISRILDRHQ